MTKPQNVGCINCRPPKDPTQRAQYLRCKDLASEEFRRNRGLKRGPINFGLLFLEMAMARYADHFADDERIAREALQPSTQNPEKQPESTRPSIFSGLDG